MHIAKTVIGLLLTVNPVAAVTGEADPVVRERQADMKAMSAVAKSLSEFFAEINRWTPRNCLGTRVC